MKRQNWGWLEAQVCLDPGVHALFLFPALSPPLQNVIERATCLEGIYAHHCTSNGVLCIWGVSLAWGLARSGFSVMFMEPVNCWSSRNPVNPHNIHVRSKMERNNPLWLLNSESIIRVRSGFTGSL